jgi:hypothetical protein
LAVAWIADFQTAITSAASITENPYGYAWITRYHAYQRGQNRVPPEACLFSPHPALALPETQPKPVPFDRIILLWAKQTNAPKKGNQDMEAKCCRFAEWLGHDDMARVEFENCRDYRDAMIDEVRSVIRLYLEPRQAVEGAVHLRVRQRAHHDESDGPHQIQCWR